MAFPQTDQFWLQVRGFLAQYAQPLDAILAPNEFLEFFPGTYHYNITYLLPAHHFAFIVFHKGMVAEIEPLFAAAVLQQFQPVFANEVFVVYASQAVRSLDAAEHEHLQPLLNQLSIEPSPERPPNYAIAITTYNRPDCLARSLPQIARLNVPIVIVDDASPELAAQKNQRLAKKYQAQYIRIPENRGLPNAMNVAIGYWLADPAIDWISYFQDDVDVKPDLLKVLEEIQHPIDRPLLSGRDASEHPTFGTKEVAGHKVLLKRSIPGLHLHAHRDYWRAVLPIPSPYLGAPKRDRGKPGQGADVDWWIGSWSPQSIVKRGGWVICVPGMVSTFTTGATSTWGNDSVSQPERLPNRWWPFKG